MLKLSRRRIIQGCGVGLITLAMPTIARTKSARWDVSIRNFAFDPLRLEINRGDVVVWTNQDIAPHTATALDGTWDTKELKRGETAEIVFSEVGKFEYFCVFHPVMKATIAVI